MKKVRDVMVHDVVTVDLSASLTDAARRMREYNVGILPIVEDGAVRADRRLVGMVPLGSPILRGKEEGDALTAARQVSQRAAKGSPAKGGNERRARRPAQRPTRKSAKGKPKARRAA